MTREEKQLLLKDLCARLPYGTYVHHKNFPDIKIKVIAVFDDGRIGVAKIGAAKNDIPLTPTSINECKPYLRPMSSMTEEERRYLLEELGFDEDLENGELNDFGSYVYHSVNVLPLFDWLNAHHFDYRGLIPMGLAIEALDGMYNKEEPEKESEIPIPKTVDEAVKTLAKILSKEDRDYLLENGAISMHDSLGRWIRNEWGLWTGSELKDELMNMNKGLNHPDDMSNYIIEEFIKYWNNKI